MDRLLRAMILVPIITAIMQGFKQIIPTSYVKYMWILTCLIGVAAAYGYNAALEITMNNALIIFGGVIAGLSASGLYEVANNLVKAIKPNVLPTEPTPIS